MTDAGSALPIVLLSLKVALIGTLLSLPIALVTALALARGRFWGRSLLNVLVHLPLVLPPVVTGYLLLRLFGRRGPIGAFLEDTLGLTLAFRWTGAAVAAAVMGFPLMVRAMRLAIEAVDHELEEAAASLGAPPLAVFWTVTLPLIKPGVIAGAMFAFITSFDELVVSLFLTGPRLSTLPVQIYNYIEFASDPTIAAISVLLIAFTTAVVLLVERVVGFTRFV